MIFWGSSGLTAFSENQSNINPSDSPGFGIGAGYEFQNSNFSFITGVEYTYLRPTMKLDDFTIDFPGLIDDQGDVYTGHYTFSDNYDIYQLSNFNIPVQLGFNNNKIFILGGVKFGFNLLASDKVKSLASYSGTYVDYLGTFTNMPNHSFGSYSLENSFSPKIGFNCAATAEAGLILGEKKNVRLSVFLDYGLTNVNLNTKELLVLYDLNNTPYLNNFMSGYAMTAGIIYGGVKLSYTLKLRSPHKCNCDF